MRFFLLMFVAGPLTAAPIELSLKRAVQLAVSPEGSARVQLSMEALKQAQSRSLQSRAALLPDLSSAFSYQNQTRNLAAFGFGFRETVFGFTIPTFVGPFNVMDARVSGTQTVFDFASWRRYQASKTQVTAAQSDVGGAGEQVAAQVARAYLAAI